jgi:8-oxo-dGTP pyrophosphatase MutT (NUDIX family)
MVNISSHGRLAPPGRVRGVNDRALHADARRLVTAWVAPTTQTARIRDRFLELLMAQPGAARRDNPGAHLTASTLVVHPDRRQILLCLHGRVHKWLQFGGHLENGDADILDAARREAREESGLAELAVHPTPVDLDIHPVPCRSGASLHYDMRFVAVAPPDAEPRCSHESRDVRWFPVDALPEPRGSDTDRLIAAAFAALP